MRLRAFSALVLCATMLSSCQTISPEEQRSRDDNQCKSYGFKSGTEGMATCLLELDLDRRAESRAMQRRMSQDFFKRPVIIERQIIVKNP